MILERLCLGSFEVNCYILAKDIGQEAMIIDPGGQAQKIRQVLNKYRLKPALIINTHGHIDHIGCDGEFAAPVYIHQDDLALLTNPKLNLSSLFALPYQVNSEAKTVKDRENIVAGGICLEVIHTPGHTPGGISLLMKEPENKILFTGDSLFCQGIGRTDFEGGDRGLLVKSIRDRLFTLPDDTVIYPGHGPSSTIGVEKKSNPFLI